MPDQVIIIVDWLNNCRILSLQVSRLHSAMIRWMITVLLRLTPDMEDKELEEMNEQANDQEVDASLGGGEILLQAVPEEICNRAQQLFAQLREFSIVLTNCCSDLVIDLMQVSNLLKPAGTSDVKPKAWLLP